MSDLKYKLGEYKGYPILEIHEHNPAKDEYFKVFGFGLKKAKVILASISKIQKFVEKFSKDS